jgi:RING finger family protein
MTDAVPEAATTPVPQMPFFLVNIEKRIAETKRNVSMPVQLTTKGGVYIDQIIFHKVTREDDEDISEPWIVYGGPYDQVEPHPTLWTKSSTLIGAWNNILQQADNRGECNECGNVYHIDKGGCQPCGMRKAFNQSIECPICKQQKHNIYRLNCGHSFCRHCALRVDAPNTLKKCPFGCSMRFRVNRGLKEHEPCDCGAEHDSDEE